MSRDLRKYARDTNLRLILGAILLLLVVGLGLIWYFYGGGAAGLGFVCVLAGLTPVVLILLVFFIADWVMQRAGRK